MEDTTAKVTISPPWITYYNKMLFLFGGDPDIRLNYDDENKVIRMLVDNPTKADALGKLLPVEVAFGNVIVKIVVIPGNMDEAKIPDLYRLALQGNPAFSQVIDLSSALMRPQLAYVMFEKEIVQFWNDNMGDPHGVETTLYQELAKEIFEQKNGILFSTESDLD